MAGGKASRRYTRVKKRARKKAGKAGRMQKPSLNVEEPAKISKTDYRMVEGFCRLCKAKIHGDISLVNHASSHGSDITLSRYLSMSEDGRFQTISSLASKYLTAREPDWYAEMCNRLNGRLP